jgi:DNA-binding Lrp family transcriptional regulator
MRIFSTPSMTNALASPKRDQHGSPKQWIQEFGCVNGQRAWVTGAFAWVTDAFDYVVRVVASDMTGIERFVMTRLATIDGVRDLSTSITLRRVQYRTLVPVREGEG